MFSLAEIVTATGGHVTADVEITVVGVSTDTRTVQRGDLLVALRGPRFDAHDHLQVAADRGVKLFVVDREDALPAGAVGVIVDDTLRALGDLAAFHRRRFDIPVIGVTGSNGKTTTKEMLASILSLTGAGLKTEGNLNNLIGLPQMLFRLNGSHRWAVIEMGMSEFGEIDRLAEIASPSVGIITNALPAHLESMKTVDNVAQAKGELYLRLQPGATAVVNGDDERVSRLPVPEGVDRVTFGLGDAAVKASAIQPQRHGSNSFRLHLPSGSVPVALAAPGKHNILNALAASAAAHVLGVGADVIAAGLRQFRPVDRRLNVEVLDGVFLMDDSYNANPASMAVAIDTLAEAAAGQGIAVLGDMLELGGESPRYHREIGRHAAEKVSRLYLCGEMMREAAGGATEAGLPAGNVLVADHDAILADLLPRLGNGEFVLVKGSRGMKMDLVATKIREHFRKG